MAEPTPKLLARIVSVMEVAHNVELERKADGDDILVSVRMRVSKEMWAAERPDVVSTEGYSSRFNSGEVKNEKVATELLDAAKKTRVRPFKVKKRNGSRYHKRGPHADRWDVHDALRDEGLVAERPVKKPVKRTKCRVCKSKLEEDGTCAKCLNDALAVDADSLFTL